jgi:hypothetical protein
MKKKLIIRTLYKKVLPFHFPGCARLISFIASSNCSQFLDVEEEMWDLFLNDILSTQSLFNNQIIEI